MRPEAGSGLVLLGGVLAVSFSAILIRLIHAPSLLIAAWRLTIAAALLGPWALGRGERPPARGVSLALLSGLFLALHFSLWIESLRHTTVASSVVLVTTNPIFVGLASLLFGEAPSAALWQGIALATAGGALVGWGDFALGGEALVGDALALGGALMESAYLLVGRLARNWGGLLPYVAISYGTAAGLLLSVLAASPGPFLPRAEDWVWIALLALGPQLLGHTSFNRALRSLPASLVAVAIVGEPVGAAIWAYLVFGEVIRPLQGVGIVLILVGIVRSIRSVRL